jgi:hypothetical protein
VQPRPLRRPPSALAGDDLEALAIAVRPEQDRLEDAALGDRIGELVDRVLAELDPRLVGVGADSADLDLADAAASLLIGSRRRTRVADQRRQAHP